MAEPVRVRRDGGARGLKRSGRPATIDEIAVVVATLNPPPESLGVTHWSARLLGRYLGISFGQVARIWREWKLQPWRRETFKFFTDPELEAKIRDVVGLYLNPPDKAVVVCIDEKVANPGAESHRADPADPPRTAREGHATTTSAMAPPPCSPHWRSPPAKSPPGLPRPAHATPSSSPSSNRSPGPTPVCHLHVVCDNYGTHKHPIVKAWLANNPRITLHFTPTSGSWLNLVEVFFGIITRQAIRRGSFDSVKELTAAIDRIHLRLERTLRTIRLDQDRR